MIALRRIRAVNYRCLRDVDVELDEFHVLVGANGSGKSALFDALLFVRDSLLLGLDTAAEKRTGDFRDLVWGRPDRDLAFDLAFEIDVPNTLRDEIPRSYGRFAVSLTVQEAEGGNLNGTLVGCLKLKADSGEEPPTDGTFNPGTWKTDMRFDSATLLGPTIEFEHPLVTRLVMETFFSVHELALDNRLLRQASKPPTLGRPTLEAWIWTGSPHVARVLGWKGEYDDLKAWLVKRRLWIEDNAKPTDSKAAMKAVLRETSTARSAALFGDLAKRTTWRGCQCPAFAELRNVLKRWFGDTQTAPARTP